MKFYVCFDLKDYSKGLERFETLEEALKRYQELPKDWHSAIGGTLKDGEIDFVQRLNGQDVLIMDYTVVEAFHKREEMSEIIRILMEELALQFYFESSLTPHGGVIASIEKSDKLNDYFDDKVLYSPNPSNLNRGIKEVMLMSYGEAFDKKPYMGWNEAKEFYKAYDVAEKEGKNLYVQLVNVSYVNVKTGYQGQADITPRQFHLLKEKTKEYLKEHGKYPTPQSIQEEYVKKQSEKGLER